MFQNLAPRIRYWDVGGAQPDIDEDRRDAGKVRPDSSEVRYGRVSPDRSGASPDQSGVLGTRVLRSDDGVAHRGVFLPDVSRLLPDAERCLQQVNPRRERLKKAN